MKDEYSFNILDYIPFGHQNAITRKQLCIKTGLSDRKNRQLIESAKKREPILNLGDAKGYFRPLPGEEHYIRICRKSEINRKNAIQENIKVMNKKLHESKLKNIPGQLSLFE